MKNFEEKAGKFLDAKWYIHFITFLAIFLPIGLLLRSLSDGSFPIYGIVILSAIFGLMFTGMLWIGKIGRSFFVEADRIEGMIRANEDSNTVIKNLYKLKDKSFARQTGDRLNELAKMAEVKYNVSILKK